MPSARTLVSLAAVFACALDARSAAANETPPWLALRPGALARLDVAPWPVFDEPEAALTASVASLQRDFTADLARPNDVVYEPIGVRVRVIRVLLAARAALVRGIGGAWEAYAPLDRMFPEIPDGTLLLAAGGFAGYADFFPRLDTPVRDAEPLATGSRVIVTGMGAAPYDPATADFVRVRVRVLDGPLKGRVGWVPVGYTGVPLTRAPASADAAARACVCRIVRFEAADAP